MTENNGSKVEKSTFVDDSQMAALVDSWATRFGALAVLEVLGRGAELSDPFVIVLFVAKLVLLYYALQPLLQYAKIEMDRLLKGRMLSWDGVKFGVLCAAFVVTAGVTFPSATRLFNLGMSPIGVALIWAFIAGFVVVLWVRSRRKGEQGGP
ncbi:hypothetical protein [uncultured Sulfitobacter sp.]|uniref:hypothetical protein n=1 Tax=uncultured Sulfitobacter sp. TaxID=191468 RepID=UPI0025916CA4|nr:hypothetical protein [uncultured Sulfitobacter sp.]